MAIFDAFIGPSAASVSPNINIERSQNLYAEAAEGGASPKSAKALLGTPGIALFTTLPTSPIRGLWANATRLFAVAGAAYYECFSQIGVVNTTGTSVAWVSGQKFDAANGVAGNTIWINGVQYTVASYTTNVLLTLTATAGIQVAVAYSAGSYLSLGAIANDGLPVPIFPNGNQILLVSAGIAYCDNGAGPVQPSYGARTGTVHIITFLSIVNWVSGDLFDVTMVGQPITINAVVYTVASYISPTTIKLTTNATAGTWAYSATYAVAAGTGAFLDGYFIVSQPSTKQINWSSLNDGTIWDPLDYASKSAYPDNIAALLADHEELWIFGTDTTEIWQTSGGTVALVRIPGGLIQHGCCAAASPVRLQNGVAWLSSDPARGGTVAYLAQGFQPTRISTHPVETAWAGYTTTADAVSHTYTERGHEFWVIQFPGANATWVYDATTQWWHERGWWNGASMDRQRQMFHAFTFQTHFAGDWSNGKIYKQSLTLLDDAGTAIHRIRTATHLSMEQLYSYYSRFQLDMELGQSTAAPTVTLEWSDDGGHTFSTPLTGLPTTATFAAMIVWRRLGKSRDRVFRVSISDAVKIALIRVILEVQQGTR